ncbi:MAG: class E sortase [Acidimicrobiales bacterium]
MSWRRAGRAVGGGLVGFGVLVLLFIAYQLWGTGLLEANSQQSLRQQFEHSLAGSPALAGTGGTGTGGTGTGGTGTGGTGPGGTGTGTDPGPPPPDGSAVAVIQIPAIGVDKAVVQGVGEPDLQRGPGHYPDTPMPGQPGNSAIAGHRTTFGGPFYRLDALRPGNEIDVTTRQGSFRYRVRRSLVVAPDDLAVLTQSRASLLTLTTCTPLFSASQRLVVQAYLVGSSPPATARVSPSRRPSPSRGIPGTRGSAAAPPNTTPAGGSVAGALGAKLASAGSTFIGGGAWQSALLWGLVELAVLCGLWAIGRRWKGWRRWTLALAGTPVAAAALFLFFGGVSGLLPASL